MKLVRCPNRDDVLNRQTIESHFKDFCKNGIDQDKSSPLLELDFDQVGHNRESSNNAGCCDRHPGVLRRFILVGKEVVQMKLSSLSSTVGFVQRLVRE